MDNGMSEMELRDQMINEFVNLQRVKSAVNRDEEIAYQEKVLRARMQTFGIATEDLEIK